MDKNLLNTILTAITGTAFGSSMTYIDVLINGAKKTGLHSSLNFLFFMVILTGLGTLAGILLSIPNEEKIDKDQVKQ